MPRTAKPKSVTTSIKASSRCSVKIGDSFFTVEYTEERAVPQGLTETAMKAERKALWETVNMECDNQIEEIYRIYKK